MYPLFQPDNGLLIIEMSKLVNFNLSVRHQGNLGEKRVMIHISQLSMAAFNWKKKKKLSGFISQMAQKGDFTRAQLKNKKIK